MVPILGQPVYFSTYCEGVAAILSIIYPPPWRYITDSASQWYYRLVSFNVIFRVISVLLCMNKLSACDAAVSTVADRDIEPGRTCQNHRGMTLQTGWSPTTRGLQAAPRLTVALSPADFLHCCDYGPRTLASVWARLLAVKNWRRPGLTDRRRVW